MLAASITPTASGSLPVLTLQLWQVPFNIPHNVSHTPSVHGHRLAARRPFLAACVARARPGTLIFAPPAGSVPLSNGISVGDAGCLLAKM